MEEAKNRLLDSLRTQAGDVRVVEAMARVPREAFVPDAAASLAYEDIPVSIGEGQTISQPLIIAIMISALELRRSDKVLEIGTGSGYQAAILAELANEVITVERIQSLADSARQRLNSLGYYNIQVCLSGEELGWPQEAPYNAIVVAAGAPRLPNALLQQLAMGGRLIVPVGDLENQELIKVTRTSAGFATQSLGGCRFVPLIGDSAWSEDDVNN